MSALRADNPLIVQGDFTVLVEVASPRYTEARDALLRFAELVKSPEHVHTYRVTPLSIWNARAAGIGGEEIAASLQDLARFPVPTNVLAQIRDYAGRYGRVKIVKAPAGVMLTASDDLLMAEVARFEEVARWLEHQVSPVAFAVDPANRGRLKQALIKCGFPAEDLAGYSPGEALDVSLRDVSARGDAFSLRQYQRDAAAMFYEGGSDRGGSGVIVLPCGAGKTVVALAAISEVKASTLILTTGVSASRQWIAEILDKTTLTREQVGEYSGHAKEVRPVTVATYHIVTHRDSREGSFTHLGLFDRHDWGLIVYDEVHLLPAPVFQITASLQARRRLGLTATLVREDHHEDDVFSLIGPKKADVPWKVLEREGWIAKARCTELRVPMPRWLRMSYAVADQRSKFRLASENPAKNELVRSILAEHAGEPALVIGMYVEQLERLAAELGMPIITGSTGQAKRDRLFAEFRAGQIPVLALSKVGNFAIDLPDASLAIQVSGTFGSRQEEAQRLGRILRPKRGANQAHFYSIVSADSTEQEFAMNRQLFLCEQGYVYTIKDVPAPEEAPPAPIPALRGSIAALPAGREG